MKRILSWSFLLVFISSEFAMAAVPNSYDAKKQAYQAAIDSSDIDVLNEFIEEYKNTGWDKSALWYRDKLLVEQAKKNGSVGAINTFLEKHPNSAWYNHAVHFRDKSAYRQAKLINTLEVYDNFLFNYPGSQWQEKVEKRKKKLLISGGHQSAKTESTARGSKTRGSKRGQPELLDSIKIDKPISAEVRRNQAALAIYDDIRQQKNKEAQAKKKKKEQRLALKRYCHKVNDQLRRIDEGRRWYQLNDEGERTFLSDTQIDEAKQKLLDKHNKKCEFKIS